MSFTDDAATNDAEEAYNAKLQEEIDRMQQYRKSVEEEFKNLQPDDPTTHKIVRNKIHELVPEACEVVLLLMVHSESDAVRANLAKYVLTEAMRNAGNEKPADAIEQMFKDLKPDDVVADAE